MLPNLRFALGAILASMLLIVTAIGLAATVRVAHHAKLGPIETPRPLAYADPTDWAQLTAPDRGSRVSEVAREHDEASIAALPERTLITAPPAASAATSRNDDPEDTAAVILPSAGSGSDARPVLASTALQAKPLLEPKLPIAPSLTPAADRPTALVTTATDVDIARSKIEADRTIGKSEPPTGHIAILAPMTDAAPAESRAAVPRAAERPVTSGLAAQKAAPQAKKRKAVKQKTRIRTAKRPAADSGYRATATRTSKDSWMFINSD